MNARKLGALESHAVIAAQHIQTLSSRDSRLALQRISHDVVKVHREKLMAHVAAMITAGAHRATPPLDRSKSELAHVLELLTQGLVGNSFEPKDEYFSQPHVVRAMLTLLTEAVLDSVRRPSHKALVASSPTAIVAVDPTLASFRTLLGRAARSPGPSTEPPPASCSDPLSLYEVFRLLHFLPKAKVVLLREVLEEIRTIDRLQLVHSSACELLVDIDMNGGGGR